MVVLIFLFVKDYFYEKIYISQIVTISNLYGNT